MKIKLWMSDLRSILVSRELNDNLYRVFTEFYDDVVDEMEDTEYGDTVDFKADIEICNDL